MFFCVSVRDQRKGGSLSTASKCRRKALGLAWQRRLCLRLGGFSGVVSSSGRCQGRGGKVAGRHRPESAVCSHGGSVRIVVCCVDGHGMTALAQRDALSKRAWHVTLA